MKKYALAIGMATIFLISGQMSWARGSKDEAKKMVDKAVELFKKEGKEKAFAAFGDAKGEFVKDDLYIFAFDFDGLALVHPKLQGKNVIALKDPDGKEMIKAFVDLAKAGKDGWVDYRWVNPTSKKLEDKTSYIKPVPSAKILIGCGAYK